VNELRNRRTPEAPSFLDLFRYIHHLDVSKDLVQVTPKDGSIVPIFRRLLVIIPVGHGHPLGALGPIRVAHRPTAAVWTGFSEKPAFQNHSSISGQRLLHYQQYNYEPGRFIDRTHRATLLAGTCNNKSSRLPRHHYRKYIVQV